MKPKRQNKNNKLKRDLSLDDSQQEVKIQLQDSALSNFLRGRSTFKDRRGGQDQQKRPTTRQTFKEEKGKPYSFIDELTCLMNDNDVRNKPQQDPNRLRGMENREENTNKASRKLQQKYLLPNRNKQSPVVIKIEEDSAPKNKNNKKVRDELTHIKQPLKDLKGKERSPRKNKREFINTVNRRDMKADWESQEMNPNDKNEEQRYKNFAKKSTKKILFLYKRSTNELVPVRDEPQIHVNENSKPNTQETQIPKGHGQKNNLSFQSQNTNELSQSPPFHNLNKNAIDREEEDIESIPPSLIFDQNEMFQTISPISTPQSRNANLERKNKQISVLAQLDTIDQAFRTNLQEIKDNISRIQTNKYNQETVSYLAQQAQQRQIALNNNHLLSRLLLQGTPLPFQEDSRSIANHKQYELVTNREQNNQQNTKEESIAGPVIQLPSLEKKPKNADSNASEHQSKPVDSHQVSEQKNNGLSLNKREWALEQDRLLLNFKDQPNDYRLQMKCMLRYVGIDAIMERYVHLNIPIHQQSYEIIQEMIGSIK